MTNTAATTKTITYEAVPEEDFFLDLIFVTPRRNQGQSVTVSYSTGVPAGRGVNYEADHGDPYRKTVDADGRIFYGRRVDA